MTSNLRSGGTLALVGALFLGVACEKAPASQASSGSGSERTVAGRVGDREITLAEVDARALQSNMKTFQELYNVRRSALEELVAEALLEKEARARGVTTEELVAQELGQKAAPVTREDVESFYSQNRARLQGQTLEQIGEQIREFLVSRNEAIARESYLEELRGRTKVDVALEPPRTSIRVAENERIKGPAGAPITIVEYSDFQ